MRPPSSSRANSYDETINYTFSCVLISATYHLKVWWLMQVYPERRRRVGACRLLIRQSLASGMIALQSSGPRGPRRKWREWVGPDNN